MKPGPSTRGFWGLLTLDRFARRTLLTRLVKLRECLDDNDERSGSLR